MKGQSRILVIDDDENIRKVVSAILCDKGYDVDTAETGADAYVVKPFDVEKMLEILKEQLEKQAQERKFSEERVAEFIQTRVKELSTQKAKMG